ncbi:mitochondrial carrier domain-containing protein, partial [Suillus fuscotomentosus]
TKPRGFLATGVMIVRRETPLALYKGLGAVLSGILADKSTGNTRVGNIFIAGLAAGTTEAVAVVCPMEVVKIRLQAQQHSLADPLEAPRYRNAGQGFSALYRGVSLTALRQATNQGFTAYQELKKLAHAYQPDLKDLPSYQHIVIGLISGAMGPFSNAPIDTIKTRLQKATYEPGTTAFERIAAIAKNMWKQEGVRSFYKGITPRVLRVAPDRRSLRGIIETMKVPPSQDRYSE